MKFCNAPDCSYPVFGKGYCKSHQHFREDFDGRSIVQKAMDKNKVQKSLSKLKGLPENRVAVRREQGKSELLAKADKLFGDYIKRRDSDKDGNIVCPCCNVKINVGNSQCLHFVTRKDYNLRFEETNAKAGCSWCNLNMSLYPNGVAYQNYKDKLIKEVGKDEVRRMELSPRNINKMDTAQLKAVIEHYSNNIAV